MQALRTKRIRAGVIVMVVSAIVVGALCALADSRGPWSDRCVARLWQTGWVKMPRGLGAHYESVPVYAFLRVKHVLAMGLVAIGVGAVLVAVGLTTPRELMAGWSVEKYRSQIPQRPKDTEGTNG